MQENARQQGDEKGGARRGQGSVKIAARVCRGVSSVHRPLAVRERGAGAVLVFRRGGRRFLRTVYQKEEGAEPPPFPPFPPSPSPPPSP